MRRLSRQLATTPNAARTFIGAGPLGADVFPPPPSSSSAASSHTPYPAPPQPPHHHQHHQGGSASRPPSYADALRVYEQQLQAYTAANSTAVQTVRERVARIRQAQAAFPERVRRDSFWSFMPVAVMLWLYIRDLADRSYADYTHRHVKEYAVLHSKVKYVKI